MTKLTILSAIVWLPSSAGASRSLDASSLTKVLSSSIIFSVNCATVGAPIGAAKVHQLRRPTERARTCRRRLMSLYGLASFGTNYAIGHLPCVRRAGTAVQAHGDTAGGLRFSAQSVVEAK